MGENESNLGTMGDVYTVLFLFLDVWHRMKELDAVRLFPPREKSLFQRPARQKFTAIEVSTTN